MRINYGIERDGYMSLASELLGEALTRMQDVRIAQQTGKYCPGCDQTKHLSEFHKNKNRLDGIANYCKQCSSAKVKRWVKDNPDGAKNIWNKDKRRRRKALALSASYLLPEAWNTLRQAFNDSCAYCGERKELYQDHVVTIGREGAGDNTIIPVCKECNSSKNNREMQSWYREQDFYNPDKLIKILNLMLVNK